MTLAEYEGTCKHCKRIITHFYQKQMEDSLAKHEATCKEKENDRK